MKYLILSLILTGCVTTEYVERPAPDYLKAGCQVPYADPQEDWMTDGVYVRLYVEKLKKSMCECDADIRRFTGETVSERMAGVCGVTPNEWS